MRVLAAQDRLHANDLALPVQRLEVVRQEQEIRLGRKAVGQAEMLCARREVAAGSALVAAAASTQSKAWR